MRITTEQISKYHPDKYADQISDKIVTYLLNFNPAAKVAVETLVKDNIVVLAGEISGVELSQSEASALVRSVAAELNYEVGPIYNFIGQQSVQIKSAVEQDDLGAGDQGIMFGYATKDTASLLPYGHDLANRIIKVIEDDVKNNVFKGDAKTQVTVDGRDIISIVVSVCHSENRDIDFVREYTHNLITLSIPETAEAKFIINPAGTWTIGGPTADAGLTGRKIVADQYGTYFKVGGGAFSGKDLTKVDRSAAYMARKVAVELVREHEDIHWAAVQVGYAIGLSTPVLLEITSNKGDISDLIDADRFRVANILKELEGLDLYELSKGCHFR